MILSNAPNIAGDNYCCTLKPHRKMDVEIGNLYVRASSLKIIARSSSRNKNSKQKYDNSLKCSYICGNSQ
jgi:hypothetical protein